MYQEVTYFHFWIEVSYYFLVINLIFEFTLIKPLTNKLIKTD